MANTTFGQSIATLTDLDSNLGFVRAVKEEGKAAVAFIVVYLFLSFIAIQFFFLSLVPRDLFS